MRYLINKNTAILAQNYEAIQERYSRNVGRVFDNGEEIIQDNLKKLCNV